MARQESPVSGGSSAPSRSAQSQPKTEVDARVPIHPRKRLTNPRTFELSFSSFKGKSMGENLMGVNPARISSGSTTQSLAAVTILTYHLLSARVKTIRSQFLMRTKLHLMSLILCLNPLKARFPGRLLRSRTKRICELPKHTETGLVAKF